MRGSAESVARKTLSFVEPKLENEITLQLGTRV
jgi:hypothetical protein